MCGVRHLERLRAIPVFFFRSIVALEAAERNLGKCKERKSRSGAAKKDRGNIAHAIVYVLSCCSLGVSFVGARCACRCFIGIWQERRGGERRRRKCSVLALFVVLGASKFSVLACWARAARRGQRGALRTGDNAACSCAATHRQKRSDTKRQ